jgi:hypothetical protein
MYHWGFLNYPHPLHPLISGPSTGGISGFSYPCSRADRIARALQICGMSPFQASELGMEIREDCLISSYERFERGIPGVPSKKRLGGLPGSLARNPFQEASIAQKRTLRKGPVLCRSRDVIDITVCSAIYFRRDQEGRFLTQNVNLIRCGKRNFLPLARKGKLANFYAEARKVKLP